MPSMPIWNQDGTTTDLREQSAAGGVGPGARFSRAGFCLLVNSFLAELNPPKLRLPAAVTTAGKLSYNFI